jgi:hypothetical protein
MNVTDRRIIPTLIQFQNIAVNSKNKETSVAPTDCEISLITLEKPLASSSSSCQKINISVYQGKVVRNTLYLTVKLAFELKLSVALLKFDTEHKI